MQNISLEKKNLIYIEWEVFYDVSKKKNTAMVNQPSDVILGAEKCKNEPLFATKKALKYMLYVFSWGSIQYL